MPINHEDPATGDPKLGKVAWEKAHKITNMLGYELVEEKTLAAGTTTCTFSGLDGDVDEEYLIEVDIDIVAKSDNHYIILKPNNTADTIYNYGTYQNDGGPLGTLINNPMGLGNNTYNQDMNVRGKAYFYPKTGKRRLLKGNCVSENASHISEINYRAHWLNTTNNISSLVINISSGGTMSGIIRLWKRIPLE